MLEQSLEALVRKEATMYPALLSEFLGTFWLVLGGCGAAVLAAAFPHLGIGFVGVALAFGLAVLTGAYAFGPISGGHFNPAVSIGLWAGGRFDGRKLSAYVLAQIAGAIVASGVLYVIARETAAFDVAEGFAANGYGVHSPGGYSLGAGMLIEFVMTFMFLIVILGATHRRAASGFAGIAIGLTLTLILLVSIPVTNGSVNPARSLGPALYVGGWALSQLWMFWIVPIAGALAAGWVHRRFLESQTESDVTERSRAKAAA